MRAHRTLEAWYELQARLDPRSGLHPGDRSPRINVTLTSVRGRFPRLHLALASLLDQRLKPDRLLLWIGEEPGGVPRLPGLVERLRRRGVDVRARPDVGPHTKLVHALREFPDDIQVTADDDRLYPRWWLAGLHASYLEDPSAIHCYRAHGMRFDASGALRPYRDWNLLAPGEHGPSDTLFPTGTGGVLYPPGSLHREVLDLGTMVRLCPRADDVWFKAMSLLSGVPVRKVPTRRREFPSVSGTQDERLWNHNLLGNDAQLRAVFEHYGLDRRLKERVRPGGSAPGQEAPAS